MADKTLGDRLGDRARERRKMYADILASKQDDYSKTLQLVGRVGAGYINDVTGEGIGSVYRANKEAQKLDLPIMNPLGYALDKLGSGAESVMGSVAKTETAQKLGKALGDFKQNHPTAYGNVASGLNIAGLIPVGKATQGVGKAVDTAGDVVNASAKNSIINKALKKAPDVFMPTVTDDVIKNATQQGLNVPKTGMINKLLGNRQILPDARQKQMLSVAEDYIKSGELNVNQNVADLANQSKNLLAKEANQTKASLRAYGSNLSGQEIFQDASDRMAQSVRDLIDSDFIGGDRDLSNLVQDIYATAVNRITKKTATIDALSPADILEARKELDNLIKLKFGQSSLSPDVKRKIQNEVASKMRDALNQTVINTSPIGNEVKDSLARQSSLYMISDNLADKSADAFGGVIDRAAKGTGKAIWLKRAAQGAGATALLGGTAMAVSVPAALGLAATYGAGKALVSPTARKVLGSGLNVAGKTLSGVGGLAPSGVIPNAIGAGAIASNAMQNEAFTSQKPDFKMDDFIPDEQPATQFNMDDFVPDETPAPQSSAQPSNLLNKISMAESSGNPNAQSPTSSASGLYQFTDSTWNSVVDKFGKNHGITRAMKNDPQAQAIMMDYLLKDNARILQDKGIEPSDENLYFAHFMGAPAASKAISKLGTNVSASRLFPDAAKSNQAIFFDKAGNPRTIEQVYDIVTSKVRGA